MTLYTCAMKTPLVKHPCGVAAKALEEAGHRYEVEVIGGFKNIPFSRSGRRDHIVAMTGQEDVPVLLLDDGTAMQGSSEIAQWATSHPPAPR